MFDFNSIDRLKESLDYEQWVLENAIELLKRSHGKVDYRRYIIDDAHSLNVKIGVSDTLGMNRAADVINDLSPLLFNAAYKILDMLMEWIIKENQGNCPWRFIDKINILTSAGTVLSLPYPLTSEPAIFSTFVKLYENLVAYRNALTHGVWGKNQSGDLVFDFNKNGRRIQGTIYFEQVIRFADCMSLTAREAMSPSSIDHNIISTIKWCLDSIQALHNQSLFGFTHAQYFDVVRQIETIKAEFPSVDIKYIRNVLDKEAMGHPYGYSLRVEARVEEISTVWIIPSSLINSRDELILDSSYDGFKVVS